MRLIDIEPFETEKDVIRCQITRWHNGDGYADMVVTNTKDIPTADVAPVVHGEWIFDAYTQSYRCSNCEAYKPYATVGEYRDYWDCDYCNICGADMRERKGDDATN